jgi:hypothetical protein
MAIC